MICNNIDRYWHTALAIDLCSVNLLWPLSRVEAPMWRGI